MTTLSYVLLKCSPAMTKEEFSHHWENKHAPLIISWALRYGMEYYAQASPLQVLYIRHTSSKIPKSLPSPPPKTPSLQTPNNSLGPQPPPLAHHTLPLRIPKHKPRRLGRRRTDGDALSGKNGPGVRRPVLRECDPA